MDFHVLAKIMPWVMIVCSFIASFIYLLAGDKRMAVYWCAAAVLNLSVTV